ncbi:MAG: transcriptional repressor [Phycisphaeraceae bacterium]
MATIRDTQQRQAIRRGFEDAGRPLSPQEALEAAQVHAPSLGIATVYRAIKAMVDEARLEPVEVPGEPTRYELAGLSHHHHFRCRTCDRVFDVPGCGISTVHSPALRGFKIDSHELWLFGQCDQCVGKA